MNLWWLAVGALAFPVGDGRPAAVGSVDGADPRVRCHYEREADRARCEQVVGWAADALAEQVDRIGFRPALPDAGAGGSDALDIYVSREAGGAGSAWVQCTDGYATCVDPDPTDGYLGSSAFVIIDPRTADGSFEGYVHHELNHALQYSYDFLEPALVLWEGTAVAAEYWTNPEWATGAGSWTSLYDYQATPWVSAVLQDGYSGGRSS